MGYYTDVQDEVIEEYGITICPRETCTCWGRTHAHPREKKVCKWDRANSIKSTFTLLHEVGHCVNNKSWMRRVEQEYYATQWAADKCREYGIKVPESIQQTYQKYIDEELARGKRRGGANYDKDYTVKWDGVPTVRKIRL